MTKKRVLYYDALKILASFFVIMIHVTAEQYYTYTYDLPWYINYGYSALSRWAVPIFCMVTGALMLSRDLTVSAVFKKSILHIGLLLAFWGMYYWIVPTRAFTLSGVWVAITNMLSGKVYSHLWYLYMLIGFYLVSPVLSIVTKHASKRTMEYLLIFLFLSSYVIPFIANYVKFAGSLLSALKLCFAGEYLFHFLAGAYLSKYPPKKIVAIVYSAFGITVLVLTSVLYCGIYSMKTQTANGLPLMAVAISATALFVLFQLLEPVLEKKPFCSIINFMAPLTFGIYLIHFRVEKYLLEAGLHSCVINPLIGAPLVTLIIFILTTAVAFVISKIPVVKRLIQ